ncbi:AraC family transcriptional regulator [Aquimarina sp. AD1]|uniref:AraC family transcriptional regulator n=1 Tax=Aquimarina sp. (strain AD1) TaxID=1714848 RepID=UPI000E4A822C|nr:AraC family transcriptional regulator [Aquimarina sp. AD1]AXT57937.1 AraC family transcriptional regulator [Aquimarina sp. AD1]RKN34943.1 helix-turn-helix domain-containing protein [Aquimarina sp. AD1]
MKALPFKIPKSSTDTLIVQEDKEIVLYDKFHQHEEIQISIIISGEGNLIVGDTITDYKPNDILVFGSNVPHVLQSAQSDQKSYMISLFFTKESFGKGFFDLPEFEGLNHFFKSSVYGIKVLSQKQKLKKQFLKILGKEDRLDRFMVFLKILKLLKTVKVETISSFISKRAYTDNEGKRMATVFQVVMNEFNRDFSLKEVASLANMTPNAFCRYFKQRTNKTFFQFLIEVRIENVCRLLSKGTEITISEASYNSGFKNLSNFNRKFKEIKGVTPSTYKKRLHDSHFV